MIKYLYLILLILILNSCVEIPNELVMPEWDVEVNLPITDRFYNIDSLLKDSEYGQIEKIGNYYIYSFYSDTLRYVNGISSFLENKLDFEFINYSFPLSSGSITINIPLPDSIYIESLKFLSGSFTLDILNMSDKDFTYSFSFNDFTNSGNKITFNSNIANYESKQHHLSLENVLFSPTQKNNITLKLEAEGNFISNQDSARISFKLKNTMIEYVNGILPPTYIKDISESISIDLDERLDDFRNNIKIAGAELFLESKYISNYPNSPEVLLSQLNINGYYNSEILNFEENSNPNLNDLYLENKSLIKSYNEQNSNINSFLSYLPNRIEFKGNCLINPKNKMLEASIEDSISVLAFIKAPLSLSIDTISIRDTIEHDIGSEKENLSNANKATLFSKIINGLPLQIHSDISIVDENYNNVVNKTINLSSAQIINEFEYLASSNDIEIELDSADLDRISKSFFVIYNLQIIGQGNEVNYFKASDGIDIKSYLKVDYRFKED